MKQATIFILILSLFAISAHASGCGLSCSATSRATTTTDYITFLPNIQYTSWWTVSTLGAVAYCGDYGGAFLPCINATNLVTSCSGSSSSCDAQTSELNSFNYSKAGSKIYRTDAKEKGNYVVTTALYNTSSTENYTLVTVHHKNGSEICNVDLYSNLPYTPKGFYNAFVASVRPNAGDTFIVLFGSNFYVKVITLVRLNLNNCQLLNNTGVYFPGSDVLDVLYDAEDDSTSTTEGNNILIGGTLTGYYASQPARKLFVVGFNTSLNLMNSSSALFLQYYAGEAYSIAYDSQTNRFVAVGDVAGTPYILRVIPGITNFSSADAFPPYVPYYPNQIRFGSVNAYNGKAFISGFLRNTTTNTYYPIFYQFDIASLNTSNRMPEFNKTANISTSANLTPPAPINTSSDIWLTFLDNTTNDAIIYNLDSNWNVVNTGALSNTRPEDIREGTNGIYILGNDLLGTNAIYAGIDPIASTFFTEVLISNLRITGRDPLRDPSDVFIIGGEDTNDLFIEILNSDAPTPEQIPEFNTLTLLISLLAGILIITTIRKNI